MNFADDNLKLSGPAPAVCSINFRTFISWTAPALLLACVSAIQVFSSGLMPYDDEGYYILAAKLVHGGARQYSDMPHEYGPLVHLLNSWFFSAFDGFSHHGARVLVGLIQLITALEILAVSRALIRGAIIQLLPPLIWLALAGPRSNVGPSAGWYIAAISAGQGVLLCYTRGRSRWILLGLTSGLIAGFKPHLMLCPISAFICMLADRRPANFPALFRPLFVCAAALPWLVLFGARSLTYSESVDGLPLLVALFAPLAAIKVPPCTRASESREFYEAAVCFGLSAAFAVILIALFALTQASAGEILLFMVTIPRERYAAFFSSFLIAPAPALACLMLSVFLYAGAAARPGSRLFGLGKSCFWIAPFVLSSTLFTLNFAEQIWPFANFVRFVWPFAYLTVLLSIDGSNTDQAKKVSALCYLGLFYFLQIYPVDSLAHVAFGVPIGAVLMVGLIQPPPDLRGLRLGNAVCLAAALLLIMPLGIAYERFPRAASNNLPGAELIGSPKRAIRQSRELVKFLKTGGEPGSCLFTIPGSYSFNIWTELPPPTGLLPGAWIYFPDELQKFETEHLSCSNFVIVDKANPRYNYELMRDFPFPVSVRILRYIEDNYDRVEDRSVDPSRFILYRRRQPAAAAEDSGPKINLRSIQ